jgi:DUF4097 and DUF4098 domain-containing protein YvlB
MKRCTKCDKKHDIEEFGWADKQKSRRSSWCKKCHKKYTKKHYKQNKTYYLEKAKRHRKTSRKRHKIFIQEYLKTHPCIDCGNPDIRVLDFDHVKGKKKYNISCMVDFSLASIKAEIKKCEIRCANCHRKRHYKGMPR